MACQNAEGVTNDVSRLSRISRTLTGFGCIIRRVNPGRCPGLKFAGAFSARAKNSLKKSKESELNDWGKAKYKRSDLGALVRGKYAKGTRELSRRPGDIQDCSGSLTVF